MFHARTQQRCGRIRESISLELDGELSRLERVIVERHLAGCAECAVFVADVHAFTDALRAAAPETLERPIALPQRGRLSFRAFPAAATAALMLVAVGVATISNSFSDDPLGSPRGVRVDEGTDELRARQLQELSERIAQTKPRPVGTQPV